MMCVLSEWLMNKNLTNVKTFLTEVITLVITGCFRCNHGNNIKQIFGAGGTLHAVMKISNV